MHKCPRQEQRAWTPDDTVEVKCSGCGQTMEFFKDEESRKCHKCGQSLGIGDRICPMCGLRQDDEAALKRMNDVEEALDVNAALKVLGRKYPELGELINKILCKEYV